MYSKLFFSVKLLKSSFLISVLTSKGDLQCIEAPLTLILVVDNEISVTAKTFRYDD